MNGRITRTSARTPVIRTLLTTALLGFVLLAGPARAGSYAYTIIDAPGAVDTLVTGVNESGTVTGYTVDGVGSVRGFTWAAGNVSLFDFGSVPGSTLPVAVNARGTVAGNFRVDRNSNFHNFVRTPNGENHELPLHGGTAPFLRGMNRSGVTVGEVFVGGAKQGYMVAHGVWTPLLPPGATSSSAAAINDSGTIAGEATDPSGSHGTIYKAGVFTPFYAASPNGSIQVAAINNDGLVSGSILNTRSIGFTYDGTKLHRYVPPLAWNSWVVQAFAPGYVIGDSDDSVGGHGAGFVFRHGVYTVVSPPGAVFTNVAGGTRSGTIAGYYEDSTRTYHSFIAVCPAGQAPCT